MWDDGSIQLATLLFMCAHACAVCVHVCMDGMDAFTFVAYPSSHTHTHMHAHTHTHTHTHNIHTYAHTHIYTTYTHTHIHMHTHAHTHTYKHAHTYTNTHIHTHTHTHTHTQTRTHIYYIARYIRITLVTKLTTYHLQSCHFYCQHLLFPIFA